MICRNFEKPKVMLATLQQTDTIWCTPAIYFICLLKWFFWGGK